MVRKGDGVHETPARVELQPEDGVLGDRWGFAKTRSMGRQLALMNVSVARLVAAGVQPLHLPGDNFLVDFDLSVEALAVGSRLRIGTALIEITPKSHLGCAKFEARFGAGAMRWVNEPRFRDRRLRGVHARIIEGGEVSVGDWIENVSG